MLLVIIQKSIFSNIPLTSEKVYTRVEIHLQTYAKRTQMFRFKYEYRCDVIVHDVHVSVQTNANMNMDTNTNTNTNMNMHKNLKIGHEY